MSTRKISVFEILIWILLPVIILLAVSPYVVGFKIKSEYAQTVNRFADLLQMDMQIEEYNQGFYSSDAVLSLSFPDSPEKLYLNEKIIHGPVSLGLLNQQLPFVVAEVNGELDVEKSEIDFLNKLFSGKSALMYQHVLAFNGDIKTQLYSPSIQSTFENSHERITVTSSGALLNHLINDDGIKGDFSLPSLKVKSDSTLMTVDALAVNFTAREGDNQLMVGDSVISVNALEIDSELEQFALKSFAARSVTSDNNELINSGTQISISEVLASNHKFGPLKFNLSLNGLNAQSLHQLQSLQQQLNEKRSQGIPEEQLNAMLMGQVMMIVPDLIKQAEIRVNPFSINSELGRLESDMSFSITGIEANTPADPVLLMQAINFDLNLSIDEPLIKQIISWNIQNMQSTGDVITPSSQLVSDNLNELVKEKWLIKNEEIYLSEIKMSQGQMLVNGKAIDPLQQIISNTSTQ